MERKKLTTGDIEKRLAEMIGWHTESDALKKRFDFPDFATALEFVNEVGVVAETHDHHPDITFGWGYAEISLTTHDRGGITDFDFAVAKDVEKVK